MDVTAHLESLRAELTGRGWKAEIRRTSSRAVLRVRNPAPPKLNDEIVCEDGAFRWECGQEIGPVTEVGGVADRIQHVLREVGK
jgi:hypothetical protein